MIEPTGLLEELVARYGGLASQGVEFLVVLAVVYVAGRLTVVPASRWLFGKSRLNPTNARAFAKSVHALVVVFAGVAGAGIAGFQSALAGSALIVGALTLAVGYAAQNMLANFVSGVFMVQDPQINVGDRIRWRDHSGTVRDIGFRVTRIRTGTNETVIIPNAQLTKDAVVNETANNPICLSAPFTVDYEQDVDEAADVFTAAALDVDFVLAHPEPSTRVTAMQPYAVEITLFAWMPRNRRREYLRSRAEVVEAVHRACQDAGVDLSTTSQHALSGAVAVDDVPPTDDGSDGAG
jgi:small-conductance mechanosensitive channel